MKRLATFATVLLALFLAVGCSGGGGSVTGDGETGSTGSSSGKSTNPSPETTSETSGGVEIEQVSSGSGGLSQRQVVVAPSADALSEATGVRVPDAGEGTYLVAFWGEKPTGGYTVEFLVARMEGDRVTVELALEEPPPDAMVSQALTQPYAAAVIRDGVSKDTALTFVTQGGRELDWAVRRF